MVSLTVNGRAHEVDVPSDERLLTTIRDRLELMIIGEGSRGPNPDRTAINAFAAQFAEVDVDVETGHVRVLRFVSAHDSGRIINPTLARSQVEGGIIQCIGYAPFEERVLDTRSGVPRRRRRDRW